MKPPANVTSFGRTDADLKRTLGLITVLHGRRGRALAAPERCGVPPGPGLAPGPG